VAGTNINRVILTGNLTKDPELRSTPGGTPVCNLRVAVNSRRKNASGEWEDKPNYFDVTVWGAQGENCATYLSKGRPVAVDGRLDWREWEAQDGGKRQSVSIIADSVQFLGSREGGGAPQGNGISGRRHPLLGRNLRSARGRVLARPGYHALPRAASSDGRRACDVMSDATPHQSD
jgi:single-strand DNA-binding protein